MSKIPRWLFWAVKRTARAFGCDIIPYNASNHWYRFAKLLEHNGINCYLDVGANVGQHGTYVRQIGYKGRIISFEPASAQFKQLDALAKRDPLWQTLNIGLGDTDTTAQINLTEDSLYNSLLPTIDVFENQKVIGTETVQVRKLDTLLPDLVRESDTVFLKIDAQGFEEKILVGAKQSLDRISGLVVESSVCAGYDGEVLFREMDDWITGAGYSLASLAPHTGDEKTGQLWQFDAVYYRKAG